MVTLEDIRQAQATLEGVSRRTRLMEFRLSPAETGAAGDQLYLKPENLQPIGAFKLRGAYNKVASLSPQERQRGVITYSSGNHAQGVAYAARALGVKAVIVMPDNAPPLKRDATLRLGAEIVVVGPSSGERQERAEELAREHGYAIVPPYNDEKIIAGQGTIGLEILEDCPQVDTVLIPIGGGGLASGVAAAIKLSGSSARVIGVEPELAGDARASLQAGKIVHFSPQQVARTRADGLRTQSIGALNFVHLQAYLDDIVTVSEDEIVGAMRALARGAQTLAEPSGAVSVAAFLFHRRELPSGRLNVAVVSGGNIDPRELQELES